MAATRVKVAFRVRHRCRYGESIYVCGGHEQLGDWNPNLTSARLQCLGYDQDDVWEGETCLSPGKDALEFKYVVVRGDSREWQGGRNHKLDIPLPPGGDMAGGLRLVVNHASWEDMGGQIYVAGIEAEGGGGVTGMDTVLGAQEAAAGEWGADQRQPLMGELPQAASPAFTAGPASIEELREALSRHDDVYRRIQDKTSRELIEADRHAAHASMAAISRNQLLLRDQGIRLRRNRGVQMV